MPESILWQLVQVCRQNIKCLVRPSVPNANISRQFESKILTILQQIRVLPAWIDDHPSKDLKLCTVAPLSCSVHRQAAVSGSSNTQQPALSNVMHDRSDVKLQNCFHDHEKEIREIATMWSCWKRLREIAMERLLRCSKSLSCGKRNREFSSDPSQEQEKSFLKDNISMILLKKARRAFPSESMVQSKLSEVEMERDGMIWEKNRLGCCVWNRQRTWITTIRVTSCKPVGLSSSDGKPQKSSKNWRLKVGFIKRTKHQIAWTLRNYEEIVMKRRKELDNWEQMNFMLKRKEPSTTSEFFLTI